MVEVKQGASAVAGEAATRPMPAQPTGWGRLLRWAAVLLVVGLIALLGWGLVQGNSGPRQAGPAPDFSLQTFEGQTITLSQFQGQVVVINFWASWCIPCREEARYLESTWRNYQDQGVVFIGVNWVDTNKEALAFLDEYGITYYNGVDLGTKIAQAYRLQGIPETFFVDKTGTLRGVHIGAFQPPQLDEKIQELLNE
jgi:cytochrome c biogenesis protein CcmG/thiol:disulfide interchange protein DsbE